VPFVSEVRVKRAEMYHELRKTGTSVKRSVEADLSDRRRRQSLVDEFLYAVALRLAGDKIAARIDSEAVDVEEFTGFAAGPADGPSSCQRRASRIAIRFVRAVYDVEEALLGIRRQRDIRRPCRCHATRA